MGKKWAAFLLVCCLVMAMSPVVATAEAEISDVRITFTPPTAGEVCGEYEPGYQIVIGGDTVTPSEATPSVVSGIIVEFADADGNDLEETDVFAAGKSYYVHFGLVLADGYVFAHTGTNFDGAVTVNGAAFTSDFRIPEAGNAISVDVLVDIPATKITSVDLTFTLPTTGETAGAYEPNPRILLNGVEASPETTPDILPWEIIGFADADGNDLEETDVFATGKSYYVHFGLVLADGYVFAHTGTNFDGAVTVNGAAFTSDFRIPEAGNAISVDVLVAVTANPPASGNSISGITAGQTFLLGDTVSFTAHGGGMSNETPRVGDTRWQPTNWAVNPSGTFSNGYTQSFSTAGMTPGAHTLTVAFAQQRYTGTLWQDTGSTDTKSVAFAIRSATPDTPTISKDLSPQSTVKTGGSVTLSVTAPASNGTITYQWYKDGKAIDGATQSSYTISNAASADAGEYYCVIANTLNGQTVTVQSAVTKLSATTATVPKTGDTSRMALWLPLLLVSVAGWVFAAVKRRKYARK